MNMMKELGEVKDLARTAKEKSFKYMAKKISGPKRG